MPIYSVRATGILKNYLFCLVGNPQSDEDVFERLRSLANKRTVGMTQLSGLTCFKTNDPSSLLLFNSSKQIIGY